MAKGFNRIEFPRAALAAREAAASKLLAAPEPAFPEDFDSVARRYLGAAFQRMDVAAAAEALDEPKGGGEPPTLEYRGVSEIGLTETIAVEYGRIYHGVPIYGARIGVEMTQTKELRGIHGHVGKPADLDPVARLSPAAALGIVKEIAGLPEYQRPEDVDAPALAVRFNAATDRWHLVYVVDNVLGST